MPTKIIEFDTEFGPVRMLSEVKSKNHSKGGMTPMSGGSDDDTEIEKAGKFSSALNSLKGIAASIWDKIDSLPRKPDEIEVKLGLTLSGETGKLWEFVLAKAETEATFEVTLKWTKSKTDA